MFYPGWASLRLQRTTYAALFRELIAAAYTPEELIRAQAMEQAMLPAEGGERGSHRRP